MKPEEFSQLFMDALELAAENAKQELQIAVPRDFRIMFSGAGHDRDLMEIEDALFKLYLGEDIFYHVIDVAVVEVHPERTIVFVRPSNHQPGPWEQTWNKPPGWGPFNQLLSLRIKIETE